MKTTILLVLLINIISAYSQESINNYMIFGDSTNTYSSSDEILKLEMFQNKVVYVDIWGTRCPPCLKEFEFLPELKNRFEKESLVFLYLCSPYSMEWDKDFDAPRPSNQKKLFNDIQTLLEEN